MGLESARALRPLGILETKTSKKSNDSAGKILASASSIIKLVLAFHNRYLVVRQQGPGLVLLRTT